MIDPVRKLRIFVAMAARLLPGVRCSTLWTVNSSPSWRMVIPGRNCVARILFAPDAYGVSRQAVQLGCNFNLRSLGGLGMPDQKCAAHRKKIIDAGPRAGQRKDSGGCARAKSESDADRVSSGVQSVRSQD